MVMTLHVLVMLIIADDDDDNVMIDNYINNHSYDY